MTTAFTRTLALTGTGALAALSLTACGVGSGDTAPSTAPSTVVVTSEAAPAASSSAATSDSASPSSAAEPTDASSTPAAPSTDASSASGTAAASTAPASGSASSASSASGTASSAGAAQGTDPAFAAIDAALGQHADGIIVELDLDDRGKKWGVDLVTGSEVRELDVTSDGAVTETGRKSDEKDAGQAREATVTAKEAITTALEGRDGQAVDDVDLDEDDGRLVWEVELDREDGTDGDEVTVDAKTGEVVANG